MSNIYLQGSEDVRTAAGEISQAAGLMMSAANRLVAGVQTQDSSMTAFMEFMDGWLTRLEAVATRLAPVTKPLTDPPPSV